LGSGPRIFVRRTYGQFRTFQFWPKDAAGDLENIRTGGRCSLALRPEVTGFLATPLTSNAGRFAMTRFLADQQSRGWHWNSDTTWVVIYSVTATAFILAWACVPA